VLVLCSLFFVLSGLVRESEIVIHPATGMLSVSWDCERWSASGCPSLVHEFMTGQIVIRERGRFNRDRTNTVNSTVPHGGE
jgi:hypothetical protein